MPRPSTSSPDDEAGKSAGGETKRKAAAALRYDVGDGAPVLVAKGRGVVAERILEIAAANDVPVHEDGKLAGALVTLDLAGEIPPNLYRAVAQVLAFMYRFSQAAGIERKT